MTYLTIGMTLVAVILAVAVGVQQIRIQKLRDTSYENGLPRDKKTGRYIKRLLK